MVFCCCVFFCFVCRLDCRVVLEAFRISLRTCLRLYPRLVRYVSSWFVRLVNVSSLEQIRRNRSARLYGIDCFVCLGWADVLRRYWCVSVGLT